MKLRYKIPHKVTIRMVGVQFVAACNCKKWTQQSDPRAYGSLRAAGYGASFFPDPVGDLISSAHAHATDHVLEAHRLTRKTAA